MWLPLNQGESDAAEAKGEYVLRRKEPDSDEEWAFACELCKAEEAIKFTRKDLESGNPGIWERITRALKWDVSIKLVFMCQDCVDTFKT